MASQVPFESAYDVNFMFTKLVVHDLELCARFYAAVFGLAELQRVEAEIMGRKVSEICYKPTYQGGPLLVLAHFHDSQGAAQQELILGFAAKDIDALVARAEAAGGALVEALDLPGAGRLVFVRDPEGHVVQVSETRG